MNTCPFTNENTTCSLPISETGGSSGHTPTVAYCKQCSRIAFRCASGHWNRAFARFCTQCGQKLEKLAVWGMASANPQRTATLPQAPPTGSLNNNYGFGSWVVDTPKIETDQDLPALLAFDGLILLPNPSENRLDAYMITNPEGKRHLKHQWSIEFNTPLMHGSTPIHHGLHLFSVMLGGIQKTNVIGGETELININGVDASEIEPISGSAPLKCDVNDKPTMIAGLKKGILLLDLDNYDGSYIESEFFEEENRPMSPTLCGNRVIFTSQGGQIFSLDIGTTPYNQRCSNWRNISFSSPIVIEDSVYCESLDMKGKRILARYEPISDEISIVTDLDVDEDFNRRYSFFLYPTLTDGQRLFLTDRFGQTAYTYHSHQNFTTQNSLTAEGNNQPIFVPHRSVVVNNRIYSAHPGGLTILNLDQNYVASYQSLAMGRNDIPIPVASPIWYGGNIFVLCKDRLVCLNC